MISVADLLIFLEHSKYALLAMGSFAEGSAVMMTGGLLSRIGVVTFLPAFGALFLGDVLSDIMWYVLGRFGARSFLMRWGHFVNLTSPIIAKVEDHFHHYHTKILVFSKLTMGLGLAVPILIGAGMTRIPFGRYITINVLGGIIWISFLMGIGYYFGNVLAYIPQDLEVGLAIAVPILFFVGVRLLSQQLAAIDW